MYEKREPSTELPYQNLKIARIHLFLPLKIPFDYIIPDKFAQDIKLGMRVKVPFGRRFTLGVIASLTDSSDVPFAKLKPIYELIDLAPLIEPSLFKVAQYFSMYYYHSFGEVFASCLSPTLKQNKKEPAKDNIGWSITREGLLAIAKTLTKAPNQEIILHFLKNNIAHALPSLVKNQSQVLNALLKKQYIEKEIVTEPLPTEASELNIKLADEKKVELNPQQQNACDIILPTLGSYAAFLIFGVTGSGKTEVYLECCRTVLIKNQQVLILLPEIGLSPQALQRYRDKLPGVNIALWNSSLGNREKHTNWISIVNGTTNLVIGTRSAIWLPFRNLSLIVVDEEHDNSFKQQDGFTYHARDVAIYRANLLNCPIILGSATPSLESLHNCTQDKYHLITLKNKANQLRSNPLHIVDVRHNKIASGLSNLVLHEISQHLARKEQVLIFLNRRGFAPAFYCLDCQWIAKCNNCSTNLTFHKLHNKLICHHCKLKTQVPAACPSCHEKDIFPVGVGTEQLETFIQGYFPTASIARLDRDTSQKKNAVKEVLDKLENRSLDILIGTQMIAKGHDYPHLTLAIILDVDQALFASDYRATEKMSQLVIQVAGRVGRGKLPGKVFLQSCQPEHPVLFALRELDYFTLADTFLKERQEAMLPPYSFQALIHANSIDLNNLNKFMRDMSAILNTLNTDGVKLQILGPVTSPLAKLRNRHRQQILLQSESRKILHGVIRKLFQVNLKKISFNSIRWNIDVDPQDFL